MFGTNIFGWTGGGSGGSGGGGYTTVAVNGVPLATETEINFNNAFGSDSPGVSSNIFYDTSMTHDEFSTGLITDTLSLQSGCRYLITDMADWGCIITALDASNYSLKASAGFSVVDWQGAAPQGIEFLGLWSADDYVLAGQTVAYNGFMYRNLTGINPDTIPPNNRTDWEVIDKSDTDYYIVEWDAVTLGDFIINYPIILGREDKRGNSCFPTQSGLATNYVYDSILVFQWGNNSCLNNTVENAVVTAYNVTSVFEGNIFRSDTTVIDITFNGIQNSEFNAPWATQISVNRGGAFDNNNLSLLTSDYSTGTIGFAGVFTASSVVGTFTVNETITGGTSGATAFFDSLSGGVLTCSLISGVFVDGETVTGGSSGAHAAVAVSAASLQQYQNNQSSVAGIYNADLTGINPVVFGVNNNLCPTYEINVFDDLSNPSDFTLTINMTAVGSVVYDNAFIGGAASIALSSKHNDWASFEQESITNSHGTFTVYRLVEYSNNL